MKLAVRNFLLLGAIAFITACDEKAFQAPPEPNDGGAATITLVASSTQLGTSAADSIDLTAVVSDANNAVVEGVDVTFATTDSRSRIVITQKTTDENGEAKARLSPGTDPTNRTILISASVGTASATETIGVIGTEITVSGATALAANGTTTLTVTLRDSEDMTLAQKTVTATSALGNVLTPAGGSWVTDAAGQLEFQLQATHTGTDTITVSALGASATHSISISGDSFAVGVPSEINIGTCGATTATWYVSGSPNVGESVTFASTKGTLYSDPACSTQLSGAAVITNPSGIATAYILSSGVGPSRITATALGVTATGDTEFISTSPSTLTFQAATSSVNPNESVTLKATVKDVAGNRVKNQPITFHITQDTTGGSIAPGVGVTNSQGEATTVYTATDQGSGRVELEAFITTNTTISDTETLTVGQKALYISTGMANEVVIETPASYSWPGVVHIVDANGNKVANQQVSLSLVPVYYVKGYRQWNGLYQQAVSTIVDSGATSPDAPLGPPLAPWPGQVDLTPGVGGGEVCTNEDMRSTDPLQFLNGELNTSPVDEDTNHNSMLTPGNVATVDQIVTTNADGYAQFYIRYPKDVANWTYVRLTATATVVGTESSHRSEFWLIAAAVDVSSQTAAPPGDPSPYGVGTVCTDPN